jgi:hypothetical protein
METTVGLVVGCKVVAEYFSRQAEAHVHTAVRAYRYTGMYICTNDLDFLVWIWGLALLTSTI